MPNPNYNRTITLYNCLKAVDNPDSNKDIWYKHIIEHCFYKSFTGIEGFQTSIRSTNGYTVRIPKSVKYKPYKEWIQLSEEERKEFFTGRIDDLVILGVSEEEVTGERPNTSAQVLNRNKPEAFMVSAFSDNTNSLYGKHYRLGG